MLDAVDTIVWLDLPPTRSLLVLQAAIDTMQKQLDRLPSRTTRSQLLHELVSENSDKCAAG